MAKVHGFRVYVVQAFPNRKKGKDALNAAHDSAMRNEILELLERLHVRGTQLFEPREPVDGQPRRPTATVTVHEPYVIRDDLIHVSVAMGERGSHRLATRAKKPPKNLELWSPEVDYYVTFLFPRGKENRFIIITQSVHRRDPLRRLLSIMAAESMRQKNEAKAAEAAARAALRHRGENRPPRQAHVRLLFEANQAADNDYLDSILGAADSATATFRSTIASNRGSARATVDRTLHIKLRDGDVQDVGRTIGRMWANRRRSGETTSASEGVSELAALLYERDLISEDEGDRYESAAISVRSDKQDTTTIAVDTLRDVFTYPVSDGAPPIWFHYDHVAPRVATIARQEQLEVRKIDPYEVDECLSDSTPARSSAG